MTDARTPLVTQERIADGVAVLEMANGRLNTLSRPLREDLITALDTAEADERIRAIVLRGASGNFSAGADLAEFDNGEGLAEPSLHRTIADFLDAMTTPVVAVLEGAVLGGGFELALSCHYRIAAPDARLGLPEVTFGFLPGAGGTQRLPRAVGLDRALPMMLTGTHVPASALADTPLLVWVGDGDVREAAVRFAAEIADKPIPRVRDVALGADSRTEQVLALAERQVVGSPNREAVVTAIRAGLHDFEHGLLEEQRLFRELAASEDAAARRHLFFAERAARRLPGPRSSRPPVRRMGIVGGGTMGQGIALAHAVAGCEVTVVEVDVERAAATAQAIEAAAKSAREIPADARADVLARITCTTDIRELSDVALAIEAVPEVLALKIDVLRRLDEVIPDDAVLATNTSSLDVDAMAAATQRPARVLGMHFFAPAHVMKLIEVVRGAATSPEAIADAVAHADRLGKIAVIAGNGPGFIGNRVFGASEREVGLMLLQGATPAQIDASIERWGMRMGPLRVLDLVGNEVPMLAREALGRADDLEWRAAARLVREGRLGVKTGRGWYRYENGRPVEDADTIRLIREEATRADVPERHVPDAEISERAILALVNEGAAILAEGIAARAGDIDVVLTRGYGFPIDRGGPMHYADALGLTNVRRIMERYERKTGDARWAPHPIIGELAAARSTFAEYDRTHE